METVVVKLSERNQMVLTKQARAALGLRPGDRVMVIIHQGEVWLLPEPEDWIDDVRGLGREMWESLGGGEAFLERERSQWER